MTIQVDNLPTTSLAGSSQTLCISNPNYTMTGNIPTFGTGVWSLLLGSGTITAPNSGTTTVTNLGLGQNIFLWTITNGVCSQSASSVILTINPLPSAAAASSNTVVCISSPTTPIFGNTPAVGTGTWSVASGSGTITAPNSPTTTATNLGLGINILQWGVGTVGCAPTTATIAVQIDNVPTPAMAGPNQTLCINNPTTTLAGNSVTVGSGVWSVVFGTANIISILNPSTAVTGLTTGTNVLQWTTTNGVCAPSISTISIQVDNNTVFASAGPNQTLCAASPSTTLAGNTPTVGIGTWGVLVGSGSVTTPSLSNSTITGLGTGTNILQWVVVNGVCSFNSSIVYLYVIPSPGLPNAGASQTLCVSNPTTTIAANTPSLGTASWSVVSGSANIVTPLTNTSNVLSLPVGDNVLAWTMTHSVCSLTSTLNIHVDNIPSLPIAGPNQTICISSPTTVLAANTPTSGVGTWSLMSGSGTITTPTLATSSVTGLGLGINVLQWTINGGACGTNSSTMSIKVDNIPTTAIAGPNQTLCISNPTTTLGGNIPATGIGTWSVMVGSGIITTSTLGTSGVTGLIVGVNVLEWSIASGGCGSTTSTMSIQVDGLPTISTTGGNQTLCISSASTALTGNVPTIGIGSWSVVSGSGTITTPTLATSNITGLAIGLNVLEWSISNGSCGVSSSTISIQVDPAPSIALAGPNQTLCISNPTVTLAGNIPAVGTGTWSVIVGSGIITTPTLGTSGVTGLVVGVNILEWSIASGGCGSTTSTMSIQVDGIPSISVAGTNQTLCVNSPSTTLNGNVPTVGAGTWSVLSGSGTIASPTLATSNITGLTIGLNILEWSISSGTCGVSSSTMSIQLDAAPTSPSVSVSQTICVVNPTATISGNVPTVGTGSWSLVSGSGTITSPTSATTTLNNLGVGVNVFEWVITNGVCVAPIATVAITVDPATTIANAGANQTICINSSALMTANSAAIGTGSWTVVSGSGTITTPTSANTSITNLGLGINVFAWTISNNCSTSTSTVSITKDQVPSASIAGADQNFCGATTFNLNAVNPVIGSGCWSVLFGGSSVSNPTLNISTLTGLTTGTNALIWTVTNGSCPPSKDTVQIIIDALPTSADAGIDQTTCVTSATLNGNAPTVGVGVWTVAGGSPVITNPLLNNSAITVLSTPTNILVWSVCNGICPVSRDTVIINVLPPTNSAFAGNDTTIFINQVTLTANNPAQGIGLWTLVSGNANIVNPSSFVTAVNSLKPGLNTLKWTITGLCGITEDDINITLIDTEVPNGISPNGDGKNEYFEIPFIGSYSKVEIKIINRWGNLVYENTNYKNDWNGLNQEGQTLADDTYFYVLNLENILKTGYITIKR
jgi:gliding motility-associated-like protein